MPLPERLRVLADSRALAFGLVAAALAYTLSLVDLGWIPHDDGMLAHAAGRVLDGELPHRDFDDPYTGGQALLHAWAFAVLGERLLALRLVLFAALAGTVPVIYWIARRFAGRTVAALGTALAVAWSVPTHPLALPSWYNLFLAILGVGALLRFQDTGRRRWLAAAGACAGVSILVKVVGLYFLAAAFLYLVFLDQEEATVAAPHAGDSAPTRRGGVHRAFVTAGLLTFLLALWALPGDARSPSTLLWLFAPPASLVGLILHREWTRVARVAAAVRTRRLVGRGLMISAAAAVPVALFLLPYLVSGSLGAVVEGVLLAPGRRLAAFLKPPPPAATALPLALVAVLVAWARRSRRADRGIALALAAPLAVVAAGAGALPLLYRAGWWLLYPMAPVVVLLGAARMAAGDDSPRGSVEADVSRGVAASRADLFLLLAATAMVGLVVFPTYVAHYVFYSAPLVVLAVLATVAPLDRAPRAALSVLLIFHLVFAGLWVHRSEVWRMGDRHNRHPPAERLAMPRGGIRVTPGEAEAYGRLVAALESLEVGPYIWATPDAAEVYFLAGLENPTRTFYDFLDPDFYEDPQGRRDRLERVLERHDVGAVVVKRSPALVSPPVSTALREMLVARYPRAAEIGPFVIFVRGEEPPP
ncbi:MAG: glycosyltransferase family 39 protein [Gemmatimonadetes bacterium]|nr:glycosyltransferase family 39 protein [Gemmatimonadota bacterium]